MSQIFNAHQVGEASKMEKFPDYIDSERKKMTGMLLSDGNCQASVFLKQCDLKPLERAANKT